MKLKFKTTILLAFGFLLITASFLIISLSTIKKIQTENIALFKNEFTQTTLESFSASSDLFFSFIEYEIGDKHIVSQETLISYLKMIDPEGRNIILIDLKNKGVAMDYSNKRLITVLGQETIDSFFKQWTLNDKKDFSVDNLDDFLDEKISSAPTRVRLKIYEPLGVMVGYGDLFETGKVRVQFIKTQNNEYYVFYLKLFLVLAFTIILLIPSLVILLVQRVIVNPIKKLQLIAKQIAKGDLSKRTNIASTDEIGDLASSFDQMTKKLDDSEYALEMKVAELAGEHGKLSSLVESVRLGVIMVDTNLKVVLSNSVACSILSVKTCNLLTVTDLSEKIAKGLDLNKVFNEMAISGKRLTPREVQIGILYYRILMSPVHDIEKKNFIGAVFVIEDITDQKKLDQMRSEIISITSHQLRTPATIIKNNLDLVLGGGVGKIAKKQKELLDDVYIGNERMIRLVNDLMDAAKIDEGNFTLSASQIDLTQLAQDVVNEIMPFAIKKKVKLVFDEPKKQLPLVKINRQKVKQVFQNLIENAVKYSSTAINGKVEVLVEEEGKFLKLVVKDNGIGIPEADKAKLFERFFRASNTAKIDPGGTGLGLYIAKAVVENGGGKIWYNSKEGEGTTFYSTFPTN